jgi:hypothetical protein
LSATATATFVFDISNVQQSVSQAKSLLQDLEQEALRVQQVLNAPTTPTQPQNPTNRTPQIQSAQAAADAALRLAQVEARGLAIQNDLAGSAQRLSSAIQTYRAAMDGSTQSAIRLQGAQNQLSTVQQRITTQASQLSSASGYAKQFADSFISGLTGIVAPAAAAQAALSGIQKVAQSFQDAFKYKAELDATNQSIAIQLKGVRDSGQVFQEATRYANTYKLTQQETSQAIASSIPVLRQSSASLTQVLGVLQRLQVLKPEKSFEDAARAVAELQAGQITSIVQQFNLSRSAANKMKDEINGGADAVKVLSKYLDSTGTSMDTLAVRTRGAIGAMADLKVAQEQMALAQAQWAQGPGLVVLQTETEAVRGLTRVLGGGGGLGEAFRQLVADTQGAWAAQGAYAQALQQGKSAADARAASEQAYAATAAQSLGVTQENTAGTDQNTSAQQDAKAATEDHERALAKEAETLIDETQKKAESALQSEKLASFQNALASLAGAVSSGLISDANAASQLANQYGIAASEGLRLIHIQEALGRATAANAAASGPSLGSIYGSGGTDRSQAAYAEHQRFLDLENARSREVQSIGTEAQKRADLNHQLALAEAYHGKESVDYIEARTALEKLDASEETRAGKKKAGGAGGGKLSDQAKLNNALADNQAKADDQLENAQIQYEDQSEKLANEHNKKLLQIDQDYREKTRQAEQAFHQDFLDSRAGFYASLANIGGKNAGKLQSELATQYEQAVQKSLDIGRTVGADAGKAYLDAATQAIQGKGN